MNSISATPRASLADDNGSTAISPSHNTGRIGEVKRVTKETNLDGTGIADSSTSVPFLDHMLDVSIFKLRERETKMEKRSKELLELESKDPSFSSKESALLVCTNTNTNTKKSVPNNKPPFTAPLPKSQVLGKVKDFLGLLSEANNTLQLNAKDKPEDFDIEVLDGNGSEYIEMDLMLGVADLHTPQAMEAAEAAIAGNQPVIDLHTNNSSSESESSSDDDDSDSDDDSDENQKAVSSVGQSEMEVDGSSRQQSENRSKRKRPKIVELP